jgi:tRNA threonylcarbamoyladenosine biosynthesis protein TsaB
MYILTIRTDKPEAELGLYKDNQEVSYYKWQAHRELSSTIHKKLKEQLELQKLNLHNLDGIVIYKGPGSFTGLRIGFSVANSLSYSIDIPIVSESGEDWIEEGLRRLKMSENEKISIPEYGALPNITKPKK